jgi:HK97 gp10 family phage protein
MEWFNKLPQAVLDKAIERGLNAIGVTILGDAISLVPSPGKTGTGRTKASLSYATKQNRSGSGADAVSQPDSQYEVWIGTNVEYAPYLEYGTYKMPARPFLRPALDGRRKDASKLLMREIMKEYGR